MIAVLLLGCSARSKSYYILDGMQDVSQEGEKTERVEQQSIGIESILLPRYFQHNHIAIQEAEHRISFDGDASWMEDMNAHLTKAMIGYLKHYFNSADIHLYPWDTGSDMDKRVRIMIEHFIFFDGAIVLDASWEIRDKQGHKVVKFFHTKVPSSSDIEEIVKQMDVSFSQLEVQVAKSLS
jgi:uncharacterized lipoprotein YmbA